MSRKAQRQLASGKVQIESGECERVQASLVDFSTHGCNLDCSASWIRTGRFLTIHFDDGFSVQGIIRWSREGASGIEFLRPIPFGQAEAIAAVIN